ncbi:MAG: ankyrin repeat domain-containing protein [Prochloron sp. SP5CPC1]|nr:ankyrin repeat domain-containing protein [Candidatus Paraprochloron terpiosi SP5CPC1]
MSIEEYYNLADGNPLDALFLAIQGKDLEAVKALIPVVEDINARDSTDCDFTPLMEAVFEDSLDLVKLLVEAGAYVNVIGSFELDDFPLNIAAVGQNREIFDYLAPLTSLGLRAMAERTWQGKMGNIEIPAEYYYNLVDEEPRDDPFYALLWAIQYGDLKAVAALISVQEDINKKDTRYMDNWTLYRNETKAPTNMTTTAILPPRL